MDSPPQNVTVRGGDFFVRKRGRKSCRTWSCGEKAIGVGAEWLVGEKNIVLVGIVRGCGCVL